MNPRALDAIREKGIAEKLMISNDFISARDKLMKAHDLCPEIENIGPMIAICDILSAASIKFPGFGIDYYWVLQLTPSSTYTDITSCYQKLVTMLRPLRYKFPGTESALRLIQDAFSVLSNQNKRSAFDLKRSKSWEGYKSYNVQASSRHSISNNETVTTDHRSSGAKSESSNRTSGGNNGTHMLSKGDTTLGSNVLSDHNIGKQHDELTFQDCSQSFGSVNSRGTVEEDVDKSDNSMNSPTALHSTNCKGSPSQSSVAMKRSDQDFYNFDNVRKAEHFEAGEIWAAHFRANLIHNRRYARVDDKLEPSVCVTWLKPVPISAGERRWCDAGLPVACGSFELDPEMTDMESWPMVSSHKCSWVHGMIDEHFELYPNKGEIWAVYKDWSLEEWAYNPETVEGCKFELVELLSTFSKYLGAKVACLVKVDGFRSIFRRQTIGGSPVIVDIPPDNLYIFSHKVPAYRFKGTEIDNVVNGMFELDQSALPDDMMQGTHSRKGPEEGNSRGSSFTPKQLPPLKSRSENNLSSPSWSPNDFATGQVWAVYCRKDFMPRKYTRINNVISESQVHVTFLEPLPIADCEIYWKRENLPIVCGVFKVSEKSLNLDLSQFSHLVKCQQSTAGPLYKIFPLKGEIWAMYKNWNNNWKHSDHESYQCGIVEILSDFSEENEVAVVKLGEVKGCLTFFDRQQYDGFDLTHLVSRSKMLSFSHRIPSFKVPGIGKYGIPESSWHLEPKALPPRNRS